ncbi:peptidylprolyl isomerase [Sulfurimonas lithotrophica]|uniref:Peptidylprolyl isomerase n=1 Tax=Sulfurimonas lithotrophica TaxID=2590022 RepID=A0A5P8P0D3_9BACT|nr:fatty acid cis/trans isomerase [Sulfurimonas lithotrophica]QFR49168.1 peptidylprolyl isomerase [Sulfurimonas lithotrophica]
MHIYKYIFVVFFIFFTACSVKPLKPIVVKAVDREIDYQKDIKPILDKRCVSCHSCYNSPCQLKLSSYEGLDRGVTKEEVYLGERLSSQNPTRLFIDAKNTQEWRKRGFASISKSNSAIGTNNSLMLQILEHKMKNPKSLGEYLSEEDLTCAKDLDELAEYLDDNPQKGMPYGFPPLKNSEFELIKQWLYQGAKYTPQKHTSFPNELIEFEKFFNADDAKHKMSARYIYEHLFLAHISFKSRPNEFYELVRSSTPSPEPINIIATVRPYDNPKVDKFYYRFKKIESTIVHKTHMVYDMSFDKLERFKELFIKPKWDEKAYDFGYDSEDNANPFIVFSQIPAKSRYQFLLDDREYVIRTFIRGPVCKGQIALNVIHDHFWVTFMQPEFDLSIKDNKFFKSQYKNLELPIKEGSDMALLETFTDNYNDKAVNYYINRQKLYDKVYKDGLDEQSVTGDILTVYRHFDSASVHNGALGNLPRTSWVIDFPLFERIYYALVAGFDIFGNIGHQVSIRRYMNRLRVEGESYFLNLLPKEDRENIFKSWYIDSEDDEIFYFSKNDSKKIYKKIDSKREFLESIIGKFDELNYVKANQRLSKPPKTYKTKEDYIDGFRSLISKGNRFISHVNDSHSNLAYLRVKNIPNEDDKVVSIVVNRWHDNVSFMFDEEDRLNSDKDEMNFIEGFVGSYPNLFLVVDYKDLPNFIDMLHNFDGSQKYKKRFMKYAIMRSDKDFWKHYDWFQNRFFKDNPHEAGLFDLNRYYYKAYE